MANDFKRFAISDVNTSAGASASAVYTVPAGAGSTALESIIIGINLSNTSASAVTAQVFLDHLSGSNDSYLVKDVNIPAGTSIELMRGNKIVVQNDGTTGDVIRVSCGTGTSLDAIVSVLEDV